MNKFNKQIEKYIIRTDNYRFKEMLNLYGYAGEQADRNSEVLDFGSGGFRLLNTPSYIVLLRKKKYVAFFDKETHSFYDFKKYVDMDDQKTNKCIYEFRSKLEEVNALKYWYLIKPIKEN